ncbi:fibronectin type III domain-containing protein [Deinococcus roseus]|uniref:Uncharacterized protein n=1 Tax=Deinococcus roseus TaxID=392414 RepID=A0ABQ2D5P8_9DEIO|nr:fibronectin type III domain-containing protein [Deinococcus roseus]GGJ47123.1 hypothetical protein GCM10008938_36500 [Deinococcus roseus]
MKQQILTPLAFLSVALIISSCSQQTPSHASFQKQAVTGKFTGDRIMVISGQTTDGISNYQQNFPGKYAGVTLYVNPALQTSGFTGGSTPAWYSSGYGNQDLNLARSATGPQQALTVGIWMGQAFDTDIAKAIDPSKPWQGDIQNTIDGSPVGTGLLQNMRSIITDLKNSGRPVFVRLGYEAEGPWNGYWPDAYKTIWSWFKAETQRQGATNIALVWQLAAWCNGGVLSGGGPLNPTGSNTNDTRPVGSNLAAFYDQWWPGSTNVDWTAISLFDQGGECSNGLTAVQNVVNYLKTKGKPIMISESTPRGYTLAPDGQVKFEQTGKTTRTGLTGQTVWNEWYNPYFNFIEANQNDIRAIAYINDNWEAYSHWACTLSSSGGVVNGCAEGEWGNSQLSANATVKTNWNARISNGLYQFTVGTGTGGGGYDTTAPTVPGTLTSPGKTSSSINVSWGASTDNVGVSSYEIYVNNVLKGTSSTTSYTITGLAASTAYSIKVRALDAAGNASAFNTAISVTTNAPSSDTQAPTIPGTLTSPGKTSSSINVSWGASTDNVGVSKYEVYVNNALNGSSGSTSYTISGLTANTAYSIKVRALDAAGNASAFNTPISVTTSSQSSSINIPGVVTSSVGAIANGTSKTFNVSATQNAKYKFLITSNSSQNSQLLDVSFNGETVTQAINAGGTITAYFQAVTSGAKTLTITARSGSVSIGKMEGQTW